MYPLHHYGWSDLRALRSGRYKVIDAPRPELYDVDRDPNETTNLFSERQALGDRMIAQLRTMESGFTKTTAAPCRRSTSIPRRGSASRRLATSVPSSPAPPIRDGPRRPEGQDRALQQARNSATELSKDRAPETRQGSLHRSSRCCTKSSDEDPQVIDAWFMLGTQYLAHGDPDKAVADFKKT